MKGNGAAVPRETGRAQLEELSAARRRFIVPATAIFVVLYGGFLVCVGYAQDFMAEKAVGAFSWAYIWSLVLIVMTWAIAWAYLRYSDRVLAPLAERVAAGSRRRP